MPVLRIIFLLAAIIGAIMPMIYFINWFNTNGWDLVAMSKAWNVNAATTGLVWDLSIAAVVLSFWMMTEAYQRKTYTQAVICILATWCIGVSCGLPLYLFMRFSPKAT